MLKQALADRNTQHMGLVHGVFAPFSSNFKQWLKIWTPLSGIRTVSA